MTHCYNCKKSVKLKFRKNGYSIYRCDNCGLEMTELKQNINTFIKSNYSKGYFNGKVESGAYINYRDDKLYIQKNLDKFIKEIKKIKPNGTLLDVGCAMGFFIEIANKAGFNTYGFDPSEYAIGEVNQNISNKVKVGTIDSVTYPKKKFDVITLFDVFEHLADPLQDMKRINSWLKDDGIIVIATGNIDSLAAKILKRRWTFYIPPQHLFFYNHKTITHLLSLSGFIPTKWFSIGKWLSLRYVLHLARTTGESKIAEILFRLTHQLKIDSLPLYIPMQDNMVVIAEKSEK
jgi:2-polyprenyl-3-methyl-5-hydroxy-6-metoxy-1,4-benzoquinol methylase